MDLLVIGCLDPYRNVWPDPYRNVWPGPYRNVWPLTWGIMWICLSFLFPKNSAQRCPEPLDYIPNNGPTVKKNVWCPEVRGMVLGDAGVPGVVRQL
jgi:hypothetical protein